MQPCQRHNAVVLLALVGGAFAFRAPVTPRMLWCVPAFSVFRIVCSGRGVHDCSRIQASITFTLVVVIIITAVA